MEHIYFDVNVMDQRKCRYVYLYKHFSFHFANSSLSLETLQFFSTNNSRTKIAK